MKYLFFDIECANCYGGCAKIFSLGYTVTDENFNILHEKEDILINPKDRFDYYVAKKMMAYPTSVFRALPPFPDFYERLRALFEDPDTTVLGYAVTNDVHFLQDDCKRYGLTPFSYRFYDVQQIYARQTENNTARNLEDSLLSWCGIEPENLHRSDEDAYNTMRILRAIAQHHGTDLPGILAMYPDCAGETHEFEIDYAWKKPEPEGGAKKRKRRRGKKKGGVETKESAQVPPENMMEGGSRNAEQFVRYLAAVRPKRTRKPPLLSGHTVTVSLGYQRYHFNEMLYLVQMIVNAGGQYTLSTAKADTLYTYQDPDGGDSRLSAALSRQEQGEEIEIYPLKVLLDTLETGELKLSRKPRMDLSFLGPEQDADAAEQDPEEIAGDTSATEPETADGYKDMSEDPERI